MSEQSRSKAAKEHEFEVTLLIMATILSVAVMIACFVFWDNTSGALALIPSTAMVLAFLVQAIRRGKPRS